MSFLSKCKSAIKVIKTINNNIRISIQDAEARIVYEEAEKKRRHKEEKRIRDANRHD